MRSWFLLVACSLAVPALSQEDPDREPRAAGQESRQKAVEEQIRKLHPGVVRGTSQAEWQAGYRRRLELEMSSPFGALAWRSIGPQEDSGRVLFIGAPKNKPREVYVGYATGGLYRTTDDGITWTDVWTKESSFGLGDVALSKDGNTIWIGSGEANNQRTSYAGTGVFKSTDHGQSWSNVGLFDSHHISAVRIDPKNENVVWVGAMGHLYSQNEQRGVFKTTDGGKTWQHVLKIDENTGCIDLVLDPRDPNKAIAAMLDRDRRAWDYRETGKGSGIYRTADGGRTWSKITQLPSGFDLARAGLAQCESKPDRIYAMVDNQGPDDEWPMRDDRVPGGELTIRRFLLLTEDTFITIDKEVLTKFLRAYAPADVDAASLIDQVKAKKQTLEGIRELLKKRNPNVFDPGNAGARVYRSDDGGKTWRKLDNGSFGDFGGYYYNKIFVNPTDPDDLMISGLPMLRSRDGGKSWKGTPFTVHVDHHAGWWDPSRPGTVWVGNDGGAYVSNDWQQFRHLNNLSVGQATTLAIDSASPYRVYVGMQDNGTSRGPSNNVVGRERDAWESIGGGDGSAIAVDPRDNGVVYVSSQFGAFSARDFKNGGGWGVRPSRENGRDPLRFNWIAPIVISSHHADIVYVGSQYLHRSMNMGRRFETISPDLTKNRPAGNVPHSTIKDISESPLQFGLIYCGTDDGNVKMTPDGGYQWIDVSTPVDKWVARVVASKWSKDTVYIAQTGYREDDFKPYLWRSTDRGKTWTSIVGNLPMECVNTIREDPSRSDLLYVGTDMGTYVSFDGGTNWESLHGGIPHLPVHDVAVHVDSDINKNELVAATHSRGAWVLPLKYVYMLTPAIRNEPLTVFELDTMARGRWGYENRERWAAEDQPSPQLKGLFFTNASGVATIRIKDKAGKVVKEATMNAVTGFNFLAVDLRLTPGKYGPPIPGDPKNPLADPYAPRRATYVEAGDYTVEITVNGRTKSQPWRLV